MPAGSQPSPVTLGSEGSGEVQTPLRGDAAAGLRIGAKACFQHAKSGKVCDHADAPEVLDGGTRVGRVPTCRGEGKAFA